MMNVINFILDLGPSVMMPIIMTIFGLILRQGFIKSFRAGLTMGIGFVGINMVIGVIFDTLGPVTEAFVQQTGATLDVMDVGWPVTASISWASPIIAIAMPVILIVNVVMIFFNMTKTAMSMFGIGGNFYSVVQ